MIVMKFGGTSVQDATAIGNVAAIVGARLKSKPVVLVSAMARVTDELLRIAKTAGDRRYDDAIRTIEELRQRHLSTLRDLLPDDSNNSEQYSLGWAERGIDGHFSELTGLARSVATLGELTGRSQDAIVSFGERLSSLIVAAAFHARGIPVELVDSRHFITTDGHFTAAAPDMLKTEQRAREVLLPIIESGSVPLAQGFIGSTPEGVTTTIGRGGSDYSAAIVGATLRADAIEIWTDVDGLMTVDPRVVPEARRIRIISFAEASELSYFGAKVLHPSTLLPAVERGIPVHIYNTLNPQGEGTLIVSTPKRSRNPIKAISFKRGVTIVNVASTRMVLAYGFLRAIFDVFDRHQTSVDVVTTSEVSVSMTLDSVDRLEIIERELSSIGQVTVESEKAIFCVVGDNLKFTPGVAAKLFKAIQPTNVDMISQGASRINLTFVINESEADKVAKALHDEFFTEVDPEVFG